MAISLYDISVASYLQTLGGVSGFLEVGRSHCEANGIDTQEIVDTCLRSDMWPFHHQVVSVVHHSLGSINGVQAGIFNPPTFEATHDYLGLQSLIADAISSLQSCTRESVDALEGNDMLFKAGKFELPFSAEGFVMSFSIPNLYFHAATAYDILRMRGVPLGKLNFMGEMRLQQS
jgi:hypothetical protein